MTSELFFFQLAENIVSIIMEARQLLKNAIVVTTVVLWIGIVEDISLVIITSICWKKTCYIYCMNLSLFYTIIYVTRFWIIWLYSTSTPRILGWINWLQPHFNILSLLIFVLMICYQITEQLFWTTLYKGICLVIFIDVIIYHFNLFLFLEKRKSSNSFNSGL